MHVQGAPPHVLARVFIGVVVPTDMIAETRTDTMPAGGDVQPFGFGEFVGGWLQRIRGKEITYPLGVTFVGIVHEGLLPFPKEPGTHPRPRYPQTVPPVDLSSRTRDLDTSYTRNTIYYGPMSR